MGIPPQRIWQSLATLLFLCAEGSSAGITVKFEGIEGELEASARNNLELTQYAERSVTASEANRLFARAPNEIRLALQPYGYYDAQVEGDLREGEKAGDFLAVLRVTPGEPVIVRSSNVRIDGPASDLREVRREVEAFRPRVGERLEHGEYERSKSNVSTSLLTNGFFDQKLERHRIEVLPSAYSASIDLAWASGERYRFGDIDFTATQFPEEFLRRFVPWELDAYYTTDELQTLQQRLVDTDYFSSVSVLPLTERRANGQVPIEGILVPGKRTVYTAGAYVSTDTGAGGRVGMERRWLNRRGHKAGGRLEYSQRLEEYSAFYRIPRPGQRNRNFNFGIGYRDEETDSSTSRLARVVASEVLDDWYDFSRTLGLQYLNGNFEIADEQSATHLLYADAMLTRKRADDLLFPTRGLSLLYGLRFGAEQFLSDTSFVQVRAEAKWVRPAKRDSRVILRAAVGAMAVDDFDALPPELRFFAGGDRSIRGFDYQQLGERNENGGVIGGTYQAIVSAEYEYYFLPRWGAAVFVDAGDAYSSSFDANVGAGVGLRWRSPVGLVRVDIATPIVTDEKKRVRLHIVIGPEL